jgi:hypothetical protein
MDPELLAAAALGLLVAYLERLRDGVADEVDGSLPAGSRQLHDLVRHRVAGTFYAGGVLERVEALPRDPRRQAALEELLADMAYSDPGFADQVRALVERCAPLKAAESGSTTRRQ